MKRNMFFIVAFMLILSYPIYGLIIDDMMGLEGYYQEGQETEQTWKNLWSGSCQSDLEAWFSEKVPGRSFAIKIRNEIIFSLLGTSPNTNVVMGKGRNLYEPQYIYWQTQAYRFEENDMKVLVEKLVELDGLLRERGKLLYVFVTPSKARFCPDDYPRQLDVLKGGSDPARDLHDGFMDFLSETPIKVFDGVSYIEESQSEDDIPVYYKTGIHWSRYWGAKTAAAFADYISETSRYELPSLEIVAEGTDEVLHPDADLLKICNVFTSPYDEEYYNPLVVGKSNGGVAPNVFCRGNSFMGQSVGFLLGQGVFDGYAYLENNTYRTDSHKEWISLSSRTAYEEMDVPGLLQKADLVILEVNENAIYDMSNGFIDYLLQNPGLIKEKG